MKRFKSILLALACAFAGTVVAQDTNAFMTQIGSFEARTNVVIIRASGLIGSIPLGSGELEVRCKETTDAGTGEKVYGLAMAIEVNQIPAQRVLVDEDEVDSLLKAVNYLAKINYDVTSLPAFEASYTSKAGLRVIAHANRREGGVLAYLQFNDNPRIALTPVQMTQLYDLIEMGRKKLAEIKSGR